MLFITNRALRQSRRSRKNRPVDFDLDNDEPQASVFFCEAHGADKTELMSGPFLQRFQGETCQEIIVFIHGFNVQPEHALSGARLIQERCDQMAAGRFLVLPLIWPVGGKTGVIRDYYDDQDRADGSAIGFARILAKFLEWRAKNEDDAACLKRVNVLAHSMGGRVATKTLQRWRERDRALPRVFRHVFLVAADVPNEVLERGEAGHALTESARTVTVYSADDDLALRASKVANVRNQELTRRIGHTGPEDMNRTPSHVFSVDCNDFNSIEDPGDGHGYYAGTALRHMMFTMKTGTVDLSDGFLIPDNHPRAVRLLRDYPEALGSGDVNAGARDTLNRPRRDPGTTRA